MTIYAHNKKSDDGMTTRTIYQCDCCDQKFGREDVITCGFAKHYCKKCAKHKVMDLCNCIRTQCRHLDFDTGYSRRVLESTYAHLRQIHADLAEYESRRVKE